MSISSIDIFDFDDTIYNGDSSVHFYLFCLKRNPSVIKHLPKQIWHFGLYALGVEEKTKFKSVMFEFVKDLNNKKQIINDFWKENFINIKPWYLKRDHSNDVIISASPDFLLRPVFEKIGAYKLIATNNNIKTGKINGKNCFGEEKVIRLQEEIPGLIIGAVYSDSLSDLPILNLAKNKFIVKKDNIIELEKYKPSKIKSLFLNKNFIAFLVVGCVNAAIGIMLAFCFSLFIESGILAFMIGYLISLVPSYFLNSIFTFKNRNYSLQLFGKFCVSYIPNFLIQLICVYVMVGMLSLNKLLSYTLAVVIGLPVTFALLSLYAFARSSKNKEMKNE